MEMPEEVMELYQLDYSDLILLSSENENQASFEEIQRRRSITESVMENLGPEGPGLIAINSVAGASNLRRSLLPLARRLALLSNDDRKHFLKEHNLGSDVPLKNLDRIVSSFAMQLKYKKPGSEHRATVDSEDNDKRMKNDELHLEFENLGYQFKELGFLMMDLGLCLARICDRVTGGQELEQSLLGSGTAKGRLIHYHSSFDNFIINEAAANRKGTATQARLQRTDDAKLLSHKQNTLWQQWHYDYGIFTVLTDPMFMMSYDQQCPCPSPSGHTYLKVFHPARDSAFMVKAPPGSFIVQVGESADVLSKGRLKATLHCVCKPGELEELSRETFVVFLQPAWNKTFSLLDYPVKRLTSSGIIGKPGLSAKQNRGAELEAEEPLDEIHSLVPPLSVRMRHGMTFAEFSRETTKQYYGCSGLQSKR